MGGSHEPSFRIYTHRQLFLDREGRYDIFCLLSGKADISNRYEERLLITYLKSVTHAHKYQSRTQTTTQPSTGKPEPTALHSLLHLQIDFSNSESHCTWRKTSGRHVGRTLTLQIVPTIDTHRHLRQVSLASQVSVQLKCFPQIDDNGKRTKETNHLLFKR